MPATVSIHSVPGLTGSMKASAHSSLAGGAGGVAMQILNDVFCPAVAVAVYTLTR